MNGLDLTDPAGTLDRLLSNDLGSRPEER